MTTPFSKYPAGDEKTTIIKPVITVRLIGPKKFQEIEAIIDSGADHSIFDMDFAKNLGLSFTKAKVEPFSGIGKGTIKVFTIPVEIQVVGIDKKVTIPIGFVKSPSFPPLLGLDGFFDNFVIKFDKAHNIIDIN